MNQNEWVEYFEALNGRKPSPEEYMTAMENGEFVKDSEGASEPAPATMPVTPQTPETSVVSPQPAIASPMSPQVKQSPLARLSKNAKIGIAAALLALIALGGYFFYQQHVNNLDGTWVIVKVGEPDVKKVYEEEQGYFEIKGEQADVVVYNKHRIRKMSKESGYGMVDKKAKTITFPNAKGAEDIATSTYEMKNGHLHIITTMGLHIEAERVSEARAKELKAKVEAELAKQEKEEAKWSDDEDEDYDDYDEDEDYDDYDEDYDDEEEYN